MSPKDLFISPQDIQALRRQGFKVQFAQPVSAEQAVARARYQEVKDRRKPVRIGQAPHPSVLDHQPPKP